MKMSQEIGMDRDDTASAPSAVVIGAGLAGLTAAWDLSRKGWRVTVLEAAEAPGGRCRDIVRGGLRIRSGARLLYSFYTVVMDLIKELELEDEVVPLGHTTMVGRDANFRPYPLAFGWHPGLLTGGHLPLTSKLGLARLALPLLRARIFGDPDDIASLGWADRETLADFLDARGGPAFVKAVAAPLFRGARNWDPQEIATSFFLLTTAFQQGHRAFTFRDGIGTLATRLASRLDVRYLSRTTSILTDEGGVRVIARDAEGRETCDQADIAICAVEGDRAAALIRKPLPDQRAFLEGVRYNPMGLLYGLLDRPLAHRIEFLQPEDPAPLALVETVPAGERPHALAHLCCELSPEASRAAGSDADLLKLVPTVQHFAARHEPAAADIRSWVPQFIPSMLPLPYPGYATAMRRFRDAQADTPRRVYLCGDYLSTALVGGACASGRSAAKLADTHWRGQLNLG